MSKSIHVRQSYSKPNVGRFFETWCIYEDHKVSFTLWCRYVASDWLSYLSYQSRVRWYWVPCPVSERLAKQLSKKIRLIRINWTAPKRKIFVYPMHWIYPQISFYSAPQCSQSPQCSHCKRCTSYGISVRLSVCPSVTRRYCAKTLTGNGPRLNPWLKTASF